MSLPYHKSRPPVSEEERLRRALQSSERMAEAVREGCLKLYVETHMSEVAAFLASYRLLMLMKDLGCYTYRRERQALREQLRRGDLDNIEYERNLRPLTQIKDSLSSDACHYASRFLFDIFHRYHLRTTVAELSERYEAEIHAFGCKTVSE